MLNETDDNDSGEELVSVGDVKKSAVWVGPVTGFWGGGDPGIEPPVGTVAPPAPPVDSPPPPAPPVPAPIEELPVTALNEESASANCVLVMGGPKSEKLTIGSFVGGSLCVLP